MTLREQLSDWMDHDCAQHILAVHLGIFPEDPPDDEWAVFRENKWIYWTDNPLGNLLYEMLNGMVEIGCLECNEEDLLYRWAEGYTPEES